MSIDLQLLERLLHEEEGMSIDFKKEAYKFEEANDEEKSELLKDILAFANSWRHSDAYILVGVEEVKGGRSKPVGVADHLDDAKLQQFINSKTNKPLNFSIHRVTVDTKHIDIIKIPVQDRPFYLSKRYGKVQAKSVLIRRGSSTDEASPEEIAKMGLTGVEIATSAPKLVVHLCTDSNKSSCGMTHEIKCFQLLGHEYIEDYVEHDPYGMAAMVHGHVNSNYYREYFKAIAEANLLHPFYVSVENIGSSTARDVFVELIVDQNPDNLDLRSHSAITKPPKKRFPLGLNYSYSDVRDSSDVAVINKADQLRIEFRLEHLQAKRTVISKHPFLLGAAKSGPIKIKSVAYATDLPKPIIGCIDIAVDAETKFMRMDDLILRIKKLSTQTKSS